jgi:hypothetical protein
MQAITVKNTSLYVIRRHNEHGMVLLIMLLFLMLAALLVNTQLTAAQLQFKMAAAFQAASQQFQAAEAGLQRGEQFLTYTHKLPTGKMRLQQFDYAGYRVQVDAVRLHALLCMLPDAHLGHVWRVTARAERAFLKISAPLVLQSNYGVPEGGHCPKEAVRRLKGRSSWRQL